MVKTAEVRDELDLTGSLDQSRKWCIIVERQVCSGAVVVIGVGAKRAAQVRLAKDDQVVQAFSP